MKLGRKRQPLSQLQVYCKDTHLICAVNLFLLSKKFSADRRAVFSILRDLPLHQSQRPRVNTEATHPDHHIRFPILQALTFKRGSCWEDNEKSNTSSRWSCAAAAQRERDLAGNASTETRAAPSEGLRGAGSTRPNPTAAPQGSARLALSPAPWPPLKARLALSPAPRPSHTAPTRPPPSTFTASTSQPPALPLSPHGPKLPAQATSSRPRACVPPRAQAGGRREATGGAGSGGSRWSPGSLAGQRGGRVLLPDCGRLLIRVLQSLKRCLQRRNDTGKSWGEAALAFMISFFCNAAKSITWQLGDKVTRFHSARLHFSTGLAWLRVSSQTAGSAKGFQVEAGVWQNCL